jgi:hypothetical protein
MPALAVDQQLLTHVIWRCAQIEGKWTVPAELVG